jgi:hypothetical protein
LLAVALLRFDHFRWDIAGGGDRNDRVIDEGDAGEMAVERCGNRDGKIPGKVTSLGDAQTDNDVLDQCGVSSSAAV